MNRKLSKAYQQGRRLGKSLGSTPKRKLTKGVSIRTVKVNGEKKKITRITKEAKSRILGYVREKFGKPHTGHTKLIDVGYHKNSFQIERGGEIGWVGIYGDNFSPTE